MVVQEGYVILLGKQFQNIVVIIVHLFKPGGYHENQLDMMLPAQVHKPLNIAYFSCVYVDICLGVSQYLWMMGRLGVGDIAIVASCMSVDGQTGYV